MPEEFISYEDRKQHSQQMKIDSLLTELPEFSGEYFIKSDMALSSKEAYARALILFFAFLRFKHPELDTGSVKVLENITTKVIEEYKEYLSHYRKNGKVYENNDKEITRKVYVVKAFYEYYYQNHIIQIVPDCFEMKVGRKQKKKQDAEKSEKLIEDAIDAVASARNLFGKQYSYADKTHKRDVAIIRVLCSTGISLTQLVSLNCEDIDWKDRTLNVSTKNGKKKIIIDKETLISIKDYLQYERKDKKNKSNDGNALFLSMQDRRISGRAVEIMIKKYVEDSSKPMDFRNARRILGQL